MWWVIAIILIFFAIFTVLLAKFYFTDASRMTSQTLGRVVSADEQAIDPAGRQRQTLLTVTYTAGGSDRQTTRTLDGPRASAFPPGRPLRVRYNPAHPDSAEVRLD